MNSQKKIWNLIVEKVLQSQIQDGDNKGHFINPIINNIYYRETAFGAKILATEWHRTKNDVFRQKALLALNSVIKLLKFSSLINGIDEPQVTFRGINYRKGSIPATVLLVFAMKEAALLLNEPYDLILNDLNDYLNSCQISEGRYYHDKVDKSKKKKSYHHVINTSSMALLFYTNILNSNDRNNCDDSSIINLIKNICKTQRSDGFWPYIEPSSLQKFFFPYSKLLHNQTKQKLVRDNSIYFGDAVHHCITLNYLLKSVDKLGNIDSKVYKQAIAKGWKFITNNLIHLDNNQIKFDFSWEPKPRHLRYCNFIDSSTYFYIIDILHELHKACLISEKEKNMYLNQICNYIYEKLVDSDLGISPYDGPDLIYNKIIPRPAESIYDKGFLMANSLLNI